ncbi:MAG: CDGSH iron-sulfur domain-containing protein [Myxococcales bacterium]|nr:CDGSH iron-sulfur domain-containing protein [Myxococcales bacterium]
MTKIEVMADGPFLVSGVDRITRLSDGSTVEASGTVALCRCGQSKNKPFCDGTHKAIGFSGAKEPDRVPDRRSSYAAAGITIHDNRGLCAHAGRCTDGLPAVFRLRTEPFVDAEAGTPEEIGATIRQCPSGALSYSIAGQEYAIHGGDAMVGFAPNGPYVVRGGAELVGTELPEGATTDHFALCRCGKSTNKPFCSGAHWGVDFDEEVPR